MRRATFLYCLMTLACRMAVAQADPPSRVAQLSYVEGSASLQPAGVEEWVPAEVNRPITGGEGLWVDNGARAELRVGIATMRLSSQTGVSFLNLDDSTVQVRLDRGTLQINLQQLAEGEIFEVDTPNVAFRLLRPGEYRFEVNEQGDMTLITVRVGGGEASGGGQSITVSAPRQARISGTDSISYDLRDPPPSDDFDEWCSSRDRRAEQSESVKYVSREMVGYEDLEEHGSWRTDPEYGPVWRPRVVAAGWAPYRYGRWVWIDSWGWTWLDDAPWGFAPCHYGRWVFSAGLWGWTPGPVVRRPVYAPALVVWVGGAPFGSGVAWFPLGPREVYVPAYRASTRYLSRLNVTTVSVTRIKIANINYVNRAHVTVVSREAFVGARPVRQFMVSVVLAPKARVRYTNIVKVAPQRASVLGHGTLPATVVRPPSGSFNRVVVVRATPPPPRVPFAQQERLLTKTPGRPLDSSRIAQLQRSAVSQPHVRPVSPRSSGQASPSVTRSSGQPRQLPAASPSSRDRRVPPSPRQAGAEERRLKQERQRRESQAKLEQRSQQQEQKLRQHRQQQEQRGQQRTQSVQHGPTYPAQQQPTPQTERRRTHPTQQPPTRSAEQQPTQRAQQQRTQPTQQEKQSKPRKKPPPPKKEDQKN
jgi:hypothetical protein